MFITLIRPPAYSTGLMGAQRVPYLGIAYVAAAVAPRHTVDIIDMCGEDIDRTEVVYDNYLAYGLPFSALDSRLKASRVIGFTFMFSQDWVFNKDLIRYVRKLAPESLLVAGGEHASSLPEFCLKDCQELDVCVLGEGEEVFSELIDAVEKGRSFSDVRGISYRRGPNDVEITKRAQRITDIDKIPLPAWDLTPMENYLDRSLTYHVERGRTIPMLASRGCPYKCTFCSNTNMWGAPWLHRNPTLVVDEMEFYVNLYKANNFVFSDLTAVVRKDNIIAFCNEILERKLDITWQLPTLRTESLDREVLELMYEAGCRDLDFAVESGSEKVLTLVKKRNRPKKMVQLIRDGISVGMNMSINMVVGLPGEGYRELFDSYIYVMKLALMGLHEMNAFPFVPYPGSVLFYEFAESGKLRLNDKYFLDLFGYANLSKPISWSDRFSPRMLAFLRFFMMASFYFLMLVSHPKRIYRMVVNAAKGVTTTKLEGVIKRVFRGIKVYYSKDGKYGKKGIRT